MYVPRNLQVISFQNTFGLLEGLHQGKSKRHFLITNVSAGNITLCNMLPASCEFNEPVLLHAQSNPLLLLHLG